MSDRETATAVLMPIIEVLKDIDPAAPDATAQVNALLPLNDPRVEAARALVVEGLSDGWLTPREAGGVRFERSSLLRASRATRPEPLAWIASRHAAMASAGMIWGLVSEDTPRSSSACASERV